MLKSGYISQTSALLEARRDSPLELNRLYNCSPAAVGQQAYATAILYNTLLASQAKIAATAQIDRDKLSVDKLSPTLIDHYIKTTYIACGADNLPGSMRGETSQSPLPEITVDHPSLRIHIRDHLLQKCSERRRQRRF